MNSQVIDPLIGRVIAGKIRIDQLLGSGATGSVYRAHHLTLAKPVAIKVLHATHKVDLDLVRRFKAEARAASRLDHPNSVRILDFGEDGNDRLLYIAMEYLDGEDLQTVLERTPRFDAKRIASVMAQVCGALAVAHDQGVVHRDMKPGNIMLVRDEDDGREVVKVCDFGLAKILDSNQNEMTGGPLTKQGMIFGTPTYMSPEQASGEATDHRSDIYSCGVIMYRLATGQPPFSAENATGMLIKQIMEKPVPVLERNPACDSRLAAIIERAMIKSRDQRYQSMREVLEDLRAIINDSALVTPHIDLPVAAYAEPGLEDTMVRPSSVSVLPPPALPPRSSGPVVIAVMGSLALLGVGGLGGYLYVDSQKPAFTRMASHAEPPPPAPPPPLTAERKPEPRSVPAVVQTATQPVQPVRSPEPVERRPERSKPKKKEEPAVEPPPPEPPPPPVEPPPPPAVEEAPPPPPPAEPPPPPAEPERLGEGFAFKASLAELQLQGGMSKKKLESSLERALGPVRECLRNLIAERGVPVKGKVDVKGTIGSRGSFEELEVGGGFEGASECVDSHVKGARLPKSDTGDVYVTFSIRYSAK